MGAILNIIGGLILVGIGFLFVWKTEAFLKTFGRIPWAEAKLGGSRVFYKLLGIILIFFGIVTMTGMLQALLLGTVGKLFVRPGG